MKKINTTAELRAAIYLLEIKQAADAQLLKEQFKTSFESLRPANLIKHALKNIVNEPDLKSDLISTAIGLATGYLTKKVIIGATSNPIKMVLGTILQMGVTGLVSKNSDEIKTAAAMLINKFFGKKDNPDINEF